MWYFMVQFLHDEGMWQSSSASNNSGVTINPINKYVVSENLLNGQSLELQWQECQHMRQLVGMPPPTQP